jgi:hypothetical protein
MILYSTSTKKVCELRHPACSSIVRTDEYINPSWMLLKTPSGLKLIYGRLHAMLVGLMGVGETC